MAIEEGGDDVAMDKSMRVKFAKMRELARRWCGRGEGRAWWLVMGGLTIAAFITRQVSLHDPPGTIWDEVHFGNFANHYINRTFYHDVHPPLGKMLIAGVAWMTGYNGTFDFQPGKLYPPDINYAAMRSLMSLMGASLVPLSFLVVWELTLCLPPAAMAALCVLFDTFVHRLNTLILLDPPLLASMLAAIYGSLKFHNQRDRAWSAAWWAWLVWTGASLGAVVSIKYVGVFTILTVGLHTAHQLYLIATEPSTPLWHVIPHTIARGTILTLVPLAIYVSSFLIHFTILTKWQVNGGGFYHTKFFAAFDNTEYDNVSFPQYVHYGANVTIQSSRPICGYLESWFDLFPSAWTAPCQQVTTATIRDDEALTWTIKKVDLDAGSIFDGSDLNQPPILVRSGDFVMLTHVATGRSLRSHGHRAPITRRHYQVCGYGDNGVGGHMETWQLEVVGVRHGDPLAIINTDFKLKHSKMNCYLKANEKVKLPKEWSFHGAKEVTCTRNGEQPGLEWHINWNDSPLLPEKVDTRSLTVGVWGKMVQQHYNMFIGNAVLSPTTEEMERSARPWMWPTLWQIQTMGEYTVGGEQQFTIGMTNPFITYLNLVSLLATPLLALVHAFYLKRGVKQPHRRYAERRAAVVVWCWWLALCWAIHYLPFFFMSRVLYYHHYCPSYIFSCMITGVMLWWACESLSVVIRRRWKDRRGRKERQGETGKNEKLEESKSEYKKVEEVEEKSERAMERKPGKEDNETRKTVKEKEEIGMLKKEEFKNQPKNDPNKIDQSISQENPKQQEQVKVGNDGQKQEPCGEGSVKENEIRGAKEKKVETKNYLSSLLLLFPASLLLVSYVFFFPLATHIKGTQFQPHPVINWGLDLFYFGQLWPEFGYRMKEFETVTETWVDSLAPGHLDNPDINATLYYLTSLSTDPAPSALISPAPASTFTGGADGAVNTVQEM